MIWETRPLTRLPVQKVGGAPAGALVKLHGPDLIVVRGGAAACCPGARANWVVLPIPGHTAMECGGMMQRGAGRVRERPSDFSLGILSRSEPPFLAPPLSPSPFSPPSPPFPLPPSPGAGLELLPGLEAPLVHSSGRGEVHRPQASQDVLEGDLRRGEMRQGETTSGMQGALANQWGQYLD